jgi:hypothetical protein
MEVHRMITIEVRTSKLFSSLNTIGRQQLPFGVALGLNQTGKDIQATQRRGISQRFTLRRAAWVLGLVNIRQDDWATKQSLVQRVRVGADEPQAKRRFSPLFARHETGGVDVRDQWIPTAALRPSFSQVVAQRMRPWALGLWRTDAQQASAATVRGGVRSSEASRKGKQRTFSIINRGGQLVGIFQRFGPKMSRKKRRALAGLEARGVRIARADEGIRLIWRYQRTIRLNPRLGFSDTARLVARSRLGPNIEAGLLRALRTAKPGGGAR